MRIVRFGLVGGINTLVDYGVLNLLVWAFAIQSAVVLAVANAGAFFVANLNSYFWNKRWTFKDRRHGTMRQYVLFLGVSLVGLLVNSGLIYGVMQSGFMADGEFILRANFAKAIATVGSMAWNYVAYHYLVFSSRENPPVNKPRQEGPAVEPPSCGGDSPETIRAMHNRNLL